MRGAIPRKLRGLPPKSCPPYASSKQQAFSRAKGARGPTDRESEVPPPSLSHIIEKADDEVIVRNENVIMHVGVVTCRCACHAHLDFTIIYHQMITYR